MKTYTKIFAGFIAGFALLTSCSDFEDTNKDPNAVSEGDVKVSFLMNKSIVGAQQDPHMAERVFVLQWKLGARYDRGNSLTIGVTNDGYNADYLGAKYGVKWLSHANMAVKLGEERYFPGTTGYHINCLQMARIWRAYMISELADAFGPIAPVITFDEQVSYKSVEDIYYFILAELDDAVSKIETDADMSELKADAADTFFDGDMEAWVRYGNSMILRYAMRISKAAPEKAKEYFEKAAKRELITTAAHTAKVKEADGWNELAGVMSRSWNTQAISATLNNIMIGLGGIDFQVQLPEATYKDARYDFGRRFENHLPITTNDPGAGFFFDGLPSKIDPRATVLYSIPGYNDGTILCPHIGVPEKNPILKDPNNTEKDLLELDVNYTWNTWVSGKWDKKTPITSELRHKSTFPSLSNVYRTSTNQRIFFAPWETYFLLAEAAHYGWDVPGTAQSNYEDGIRASFEYHGIPHLVNDYLQSTEYNRIGTSVAFTHTTEAASYTASYKDGYTGESKTFTYTYPKNSIYRNGDYNNDILTKIITQKYLAQNPWLPLEAWCDHRRLGLPFFENQAVEVNYVTSNNELPLTTSNYMECKWEFYQERFPYPAILEVNSKTGYDEAVRLLNGPDKNTTPLWWTGRK